MLYIMRHGQTDWNFVHKLQGNTNTVLNETGRAMARAAREKYPDLPIDVCYVSPLSRAQETAEIFLEGRHVPIRTDLRLREFSFGSHEGDQNIFEQPEHPLYPFFKDPEHYRAQDGAESFEELFARTGAFIEDTLKPELAAGKNVLVVGHGGMNLSIVNRIRQVPVSDFWRYHFGNCDIMAIEDSEVLSLPPDGEDS